MWLPLLFSKLQRAVVVVVAVCVCVFFFLKNNYMEGTVSATIK